ncbi:fimbrial protein [Paraburkholderia fungorum]|uniref:fimbrial protein n=1 Tax=Paraburkholderia fungorum TaxID=134537 RepID=UPI0038BBA3A7
MLVLFAALLSASAHANLSCNPGPLNIVLNAGTISVPVNAAVGATVKTVAPDAFQFLCSMGGSGGAQSSATLYGDLTVTNPLAPGFNDVYQTGITGLGIRYTFNSANCGISNQVLANGSTRLNCPFTGPAGGSAVPLNLTVTSILVVTGTIAPGASTLSTIPQIALTFRTSDGGTASWAKSPIYSGSATGTLTHATCSVSQPNIYVPLATADTRAFAAGSGAVFAPTPFSLTFACSAGAKVSITLTDNVNPASRSNTLQLTADSSAKGIGIQVLNGSGPVSFGADAATPGNTNQWLIGDSPNGQLQVPLTARYISTGAVSAGTVKALATFTISYQ